MLSDVSDFADTLVCLRVGRRGLLLVMLVLEWVLGWSTELRWLVRLIREVRRLLAWWHVNRFRGWRSVTSFVAFRKAHVLSHVFVILHLISSLVFLHLSLFLVILFHLLFQLTAILIDLSSLCLSL